MKYDACSAAPVVCTCICCVSFCLNFIGVYMDAHIYPISVRVVAKLWPHSHPLLMKVHVTDLRDWTSEKPAGSTLHSVNLLKRLGRALAHSGGALLMRCDVAGAQIASFLVWLCWSLAIYAYSALVTDPPHVFVFSSF